MSKVLVIGDIIIDKYIYGSSSRLSPEAPVPVITYHRQIETLGGAGLVYENLRNLGVDVDLYDHNSERSIKTRIICDGHYITRIDEDKFVNGTDVLDQIINDDFSKYDFVILSDYNKGSLNESKKIIEYINQFGCKIIVDPKKNASYYKDAWLVKPNHGEFDVFEFADWGGNIIVTNSNNNVTALIDDKVYDIPVDTVDVSDVTGAGDCFLAAFVYSLVRGYDYQKCLELAVKGSSESVKHRGTYILKVEDIEERIVFTNGVFDILHHGHLKLLSEAYSLGTRLVVGINSDASVKRLKGDNRPINNQIKRKNQLEILPWISEVFIFNEDTPYELIQKINPHLIVKGGDYTKEQVVGNDLAPVHIVPTLEGYSTTNIIKKSNENTSNRS